MRQPTYAFGRISCPVCSRSSHLASVALFPLSLFLAVIVPGVWVLLRSLENEILFPWVKNLVRQWIHVLRQLRWWLRTCFTHFLRCGGLASWSVLSLFGLNGEVFPVDASGCCLALRSSHLETWKSFLRASRGCDAWSGTAFFVAPVSVTGAGLPVQPVSRTPGWPAHMPISS